MPNIDMTKIVDALNSQKPAVEQILKTDNAQATPVSNATDIDTLGGIIVLLCQFIENANQIDLDQEKRIQMLEAKNEQYKKVEQTEPTPAMPERLPENTATGE